METIVVMQLFSLTEMIMVTQFFTSLLSAFARSRARTCGDTMLRLDDHLLRDIGLTQNDVLNCMSKPAHKAEGCLPASRTRNLETAAPAQNPPAAAPAGHLAA